jgi:hypothetical protein
MRSLLFTSLLVLWGCPADSKLKDSGAGGTDDTPDPDAECSEDIECSSWQICDDHECVDGDRNNAIDEAEAVSLEDGAGLDRYINTAGDVDYFSFESGGGEFIAAFTNTPEVEEGSPVPDTFLTLYAPDGSVVTTADNYTNGWVVSDMDAGLWGYAAEAGTYILEVKDANPLKDNEAWGGQGFSYNLTAYTWGRATYGESSLTDPFDFGDGGLSVDTGVLRVVGVLLEEPGQVDYILIDFPYDNTAFYVDGAEDLSGSDANPVATISTTDGVIMSERDEVGPNSGVYHPALNAGQYIITVRDAEGGGGTNHWAVLVLKVYGEGDAIAPETEPNDAQAQATPIEMGEYENASGHTYFDGTIWGGMDSADDTDFFKIDVSGDATAETEDGEEVQYLMVCSTSSRWGSAIAPTITVYDETGTELASSEGDPDEYPNNTIENVAITPGSPVYLAVTGDEETAGTPDEWYLIRTYVASFEVATYADGGYSCPNL